MTNTGSDQGQPRAEPDGNANHSSIEYWHRYEPWEAGPTRVPTRDRDGAAHSIFRVITPRRLLSLVLAVVLLGAAAGYVGALLWPKEYAARAEILYEISTEKPTGFLREDRSLTTQLVTLRSRQVLAPVAIANGVPVEQIEKQVTISLLDSSEIIQVETRAGDRDTAQNLTRSIVDRYRQIVLTQDGSGATGYLNTQLSQVQDGLAKARTELERQRAQQASGSIGTSALASAEAQVQGLSDREQNLRRQLDELTVAGMDAPRTEVVVPPYGVSDPVSPRPGFAAASGALAAFVVAALTVVVIVHRRSRMSGAE
ncbi:hypothetical protein [Saccharopolyspora endophytica]|uniref:Polysaccharide chain length determinant N-terminal domain-containing protein n=1 Tax=Saccharopolyspora endophytica TaxID=543886 RepID=A0ABS5DDN7_9PSEU|nr:hypothetical protein [Saccharopolyspora endophytica]MBQ0924277.1 hypothetical protein [Saccharopolyspora endophytica]